MNEIIPVRTFRTNIFYGLIATTLAGVLAGQLYMNVNKNGFCKVMKNENIKKERKK